MLFGEVFFVMYLLTYRQKSSVEPWKVKVHSKNCLRLINESSLNMIMINEGSELFLVTREAVFLCAAAAEMDGTVPCVSRRNRQQADDQVCRRVRLFF